MLNLPHLLLTVSLLIVAYGFTIQPRIINGLLSDPSDFKFFVSFRGWKSKCSAVLISDKWILTAGHCLKPNVTIALSIEMDNTIDDIYIEPINQHIYPQFQWIGNIPMFDMGLIQLPSDVLPIPQAQPINLSLKCDSDLDNIDVVAIGNGATVASMQMTGDSILHHVYLKTMSSDECKNRLKRHTNELFAVICADPHEGKYVYHGDSGGPLIHRIDGSLIGITSFADVDPGTYSTKYTLQVFTRVHAYFDWIEKITGLEMPKCN